MENNTFRNIAIWLVVTLTIIIVILIVVGLSAGPGPTTGGLTVPVNSSDQISGTSAPTLTIVEYSDYQCPACAAFNPTVKEIMALYGDKILFAYRNFPLEQHKNAKSSAVAAEAAALQGKFLEMQEKLFTNQSEWGTSDDSRNIFIRYAKELSLDTGKFADDLLLPEIANKIAADLQSGKDSGVNSTPSFFLNGKKYVDSGKARTLDEALNEFKQFVKKNL